ncbi:hypothetical protein M408DRAFT_19387 [Serendipita vermifera MAFF 305830]|uniref:Vacuolar membrane protease transmembrane domain-containing protein n=1 Tax=Serendipita vermifera MAFF 305830 TaxID=933852 RepID=A0A0C2Y057_SERVB|nr:hypothetical protein M408DRAFT_19387 [Serendipita vermifera MAFF 305830]
MVPSDIALLIAGPILVSLLVFEANRENKVQYARRGLFRFPLALGLAIAACLGTSLLYSKVNPYVIYSYPNAVLFSLVALGFVVLFIVLAGAAWLLPTPHQTTTVLIESLIMWWIIIIIDIKGLLERRAFFFTPFLYVSTLISIVAMLLRTSRPEVHTLPGAIRLPESNGTTESSDDHVSIFARGRTRIVDMVKGWDLDLRKGVIIGTTLGTQLGLFIVLMVMKDSYFQYQQPREIMLVDAASALFLVLPLAIFMHKMHWSIPILFSLVFIGTFFFSLFIFPFTPYSPAYLEFSQIVSLDNGTNVVQVAGPRGYTENDIVPHFPSFNNSKDLHKCAESPSGLAGQPESSFCTWHGLPTPEPPIDLLTVIQYRLLGPAVTVKVTYSLECKGYGLEFGGSPQPRWEGVSRAEEVNGRVTETFKVWFSDKVPKYTARVSCVWYGLEKKHVPAYTEANLFSPSWASIGGDGEGLVTAERYIDIE